MRSVSAWLLVSMVTAACGGDGEPGDADLAALKVRNLATPAPGLLTSGQPDVVQFEQLARLGVDRIVCLRPADEPGTGWEEEKAKELGITFVRLPISGPGDVSEANARKLAAAMGDGSGTTMVACGSSNRVGALLALKAFHVDRKPADEALAFGKRAGLSQLTARVEELLQQQR